MRQDIEIKAGTDLAHIASTLKQSRVGVLGCIAYGSCLRSGDAFAGLVDFYLLVETYRSIHGWRGLGLAAGTNWLLAPNVYYAELCHSNRVARIKYSVLSLADFERGCSRWFESYLWGRFAQPVGLYGFERPHDRIRVQQALQCAGARLVRETLPLMPASFTAQELWTCGLARSYASELRAEKAFRVREIYQYAPQHYRGLAAASLALATPNTPSTPVTPIMNGTQVDDARWTKSCSKRAEILARMKWGLRRVLGKGLSVLRVVKAYFTFRGGIDYLAWKLSRHSGREIKVPMRVRKYPLVFGWGFLLRLYREGVFR